MKDKRQYGMFFIVVMPSTEGGFVWLLCVEDTIYKKSERSYEERATAWALAEEQLRALLTFALAALP